MLFIHQTEEEPLSLRLAGQQRDAESSLSCNIHCYYDPARGRYRVQQSDLKVGDRIYVRERITNMYQLAFHLAVEHTKQEIKRLYAANAGHSINGISLHDIFKMDAQVLQNSRVSYDTRHAKN